MIALCPVSHQHTHQGLYGTVIHSKVASAPLHSELKSVDSNSLKLQRGRRVMCRCVGVKVTDL